MKLNCLLIALVISAALSLVSCGVKESLVLTIPEDAQVCVNAGTDHNSVQVRRHRLSQKSQN